jgi:hypothetical protein
VELRIVRRAGGDHGTLAAMYFSSQGALAKNWHIQPTVLCYTSPTACARLSI